MKKDPFMPATFFCSSYAANYDWTTSAETSGNHRKITYDLHAVLTDLIYARILSPSSKLSSYAYCQTLLEPPKYSLHNVYRALSVLAEESDFIQEELYRNSNFVHPRNTRVLYYDCTNYYFEIEEENGNKNMIRDFECSDFIFCSDAGRGSKTTVSLTVLEIVLT